MCPSGIEAINTGDWVTLSRDYAEQYAMDDSDPEKDWPVIEYQVPVSTVFTDGNDSAEYFYTDSVLSMAAVHDQKPTFEPSNDDFITKATADNDDFASSAIRSIRTTSAKVGFLALIVLWTRLR
ncbi:hypothetical protein [Glutamicibacter sp.]|uniref:hypothetical protein n=1 Tax=Glutamicibacter sp. TaxID=1931995 RepID=UPI0028BDA405|nr:hypothetical protein [Glutamicibacter sp.]